MKLTTRCNREYVGVEDIEAGEGHVTQIRGGVHHTYHKVTMVKDVGLLADAVVNGLDASGAELIRFGGFYSPLDGGEGLYRKAQERLEVHDIGVFFTTEDATYIREGVTGPVDIRWFGAVGDGVANDLEAFTRAFMYPSILLAGGHYLLRSDTKITIELTKGFEILGNDSTIDLRALTRDCLLSFKPVSRILYFNIQDVKFTGVGVTKAFELLHQDLISFINANHLTTYEPEGLMPNIPSFVYGSRDQVITGKWTFTDAPTSNSQPTLDRHPVTKAFIDSLTTIDETNYVTYTSNKEITALKNYVTPPKAKTGKQLTSAVRAIDMVEYFKQFMDEYKQLIPTDLIEATPEVGSTYIVPPTNGGLAVTNPNTKFPGTTWELIGYQDSLLSSGAQVERLSSGSTEAIYFQVWKRTA